MSTLYSIINELANIVSGLTHKASSFALKSQLTGLLSQQLDPKFAQLSGQFALSNYVNPQFEEIYSKLSVSDQISAKLAEISDFQIGQGSGYVSQQVDPLFVSNSGLFELRAERVGISNDSVVLQSNKFYKVQTVKESLDIVIPSGITNSFLLFSTGETFVYNISVDSAMYVNQPFEFEPERTYLIGVEDTCIVWSDMTAAN